jgi:hypothetical protein
MTKRKMTAKPTTAVCPTCGIALTAGDRTVQRCSNGHRLPREAWHTPIETATGARTSEPPTAAGDGGEAIIKALQVLILDPKTRAYLRANDPKALQQAAKALHDVDARYLLIDVPTDLCWYCFAPLVCTFADGEAYCSACGTVRTPGQLQAEPAE